MPKEVRFGRFVPNLDKYSGGALFGTAFDGEGVLSLNKYGEFLHELTPDGDLIAGFLDNGIICSYDDKGRLDIVSLDFEKSIHGLTDEELEMMPNKGQDLMRIEQLLSETKMKVLLSIDVKGKKLEVLVYGDNGYFARDKMKPVDLEAGDDGFVRIQGINIPYRVERSGDEISIGIGEASADDSVLDMVVVSDNVDFIDDVLAGTPKDIQRLAEKIILN